jgi:hypothetical protein
LQRQNLCDGFCLEWKKRICHDATSNPFVSHAYQKSRMSREELRTTSHMAINETESSKAIVK